jgi:hypothetical protein
LGKYTILVFKKNWFTPSANAAAITAIGGSALKFEKGAD